MGVTSASLPARREVEPQFPVRVAVPPEGFGRQLKIIHAWLDETCGPEGWAMAPAGFTSVINNAIPFYFADAVVAHAFLTCFCWGYRVSTIGDGCAHTPARCSGS